MGHVVDGLVVDTVQITTAPHQVTVAPLQGSFLWYGLLFFALAVVAGLVGWQNVAGMSMRVARIFVLIFLVLAVVSLLL